MLLKQLFGKFDAATKVVADLYRLADTTNLK